jgi:hypothetical protein
MGAIRRTRHVRPRVESLEGRALLSTVQAGAVVSTACVQGAESLSLRGSASGSFSIFNGYTLQGSGRLDPLGPVELLGTIRGIAIGVRQGRAEGAIHLHYKIQGEQRALVLRLEGPLLRDGPKPPPSGTYQYKIAAGRGEGSTGTVDISFQLAPERRFSMTFRG